MHTMSARARNVEKEHEPMPDPRSTRRDVPLGSALLLALAFVAFVVIGIVTVILPEIENADEAESAAPTAPEPAEPSTPTPAPTP